MEGKFSKSVAIDAVIQIKFKNKLKITAFDFDMS